MRECKAHEWGTGQQMLASAHLVCSMGPCCAAVQYRRPYLTPEERELLDLQNGMEEEMAEQYKQVCVHVYPVLVCAVAWSSVQKQLPSLFCRNSLKEGESGFLNTETIPCRRPRPQVERVIGERRFMLQQPQPGSVDDDGQGGVLRWLCKWRGLPYCDSTYETRSDLEAAGQAHFIQEFQVRVHPGCGADVGSGMPLVLLCWLVRCWGTAAAPLPYFIHKRTTAPLLQCVYTACRTASAASASLARPSSRSAARLRRAAPAPSPRSPTTSRVRAGVGGGGEAVMCRREATGPPDACRLTDQPSAADCRPVPVPCCMPCLQVAASCATTNWTASTGWPTAGARA